MDAHERIWLIDMGDCVAWHDDPNPEGSDDDEKPDAIEYVHRELYDALGASLGIANDALAESDRVNAELEEERDALAAHVGELVQALEWSDYASRHGGLTPKIVDAIRSALSRAPATSLTRRDALVKGEALESLASEARRWEPGDLMRLSIEYRRRAEDPAGGAAPGSGPRHLLMPESLTVEGGFKKALIGEFSERCDERCSECLDGRDYDDSDECENCDGSGYVPQRVAVRWSTIKAIYAAAVAHYRRQAEGGDA